MTGQAWTSRRPLSTSEEAWWADFKTLESINLWEEREVCAAAQVHESSETFTPGKQYRH